MQEYRVELEAYAGPLDLLLYLVKRHEIDLNDIPIAKLTDQYLKHLELIKQIDINLAGEFLVMASTLLEVKSAMLLPPTVQSDGQTAQSEATSDISSMDPRYELVQQLLAYKRFKDAANALGERRESWESRFPNLPFVPRERPAGAAGEGEDAGEDENAAPMEIDLDDASVLDLCEAFARILESVGKTPHRHEVVYDDTPIALHAEDIVDRLQREGPLTLQAVFVGRTSRSELIGLFLATLELVRQRKIRVLQEELGDISLQLRDKESEPADNDKARDWRNPATGEIEYDWPSEEDRKRALRRAHLRALYAKKGELLPEEEQALAEEAAALEDAEGDAPAVPGGEDAGDEVEADGDGDVSADDDQTTPGQ